MVIYYKSGLNGRANEVFVTKSSGMKVIHGDRVELSLVIGDLPELTLELERQWRATQQMWKIHEITMKVKQQLPLIFI